MTGFSITRGNPSPEEIAIAISVLHAAAGAASVGAATAPAPRSAWSAPARRLRPVHHPVGPRQWALAQRVR